MKILKLEYIDEESNIIHSVSGITDSPLELSDIDRYFWKLKHDIYYTRIKEIQQLEYLKEK